MCRGWGLKCKCTIEVRILDCGPECKMHEVKRTLSKSSTGDTKFTRRLGIALNENVRREVGTMAVKWS
jgi:hypothetical protein